MKTKTFNNQAKRKSFYKLLDSLEEKDFYAVKSFAEFIKTKIEKKLVGINLNRMPEFH
ncbi:MAG: hypothetical protein M3R36_09125 [Bacteroidota bacterium]|nr:hypothetical protein [Bacteroidota bacterium]